MIGYKRESELNPKSDDCAQASHWWHALDQPSTEWEVTLMVAGLVTGLQPDSCIETGCYLGQTTMMMGQALQASGHGKLLAIDNDRQRCQQARERCVNLPVEVLLTDARNWHPDRHFDFAFVDSGDPKDRMGDLNVLLPWLAPNAVVVFHDSGTQFGLRYQLEEWVASTRGMWRMILLPTPRGLAILNKRVIPALPK